LLYTRVLVRISIHVLNVEKQKHIALKLIFPNKFLKLKLKIEAEAHYKTKDDLSQRTQGCSIDVLSWPNKSIFVSFDYIHI